MKNVITRPPSKSFINSINDWYVKNKKETSEPIDFEKTQSQFYQYLNCLEKIGAKINTLPQNNLFPDGCFTQDPVIVYKKSSLKLNLFAKSRRGEGDEIERKLKEFGINTENMKHGFCDGGDVLMMEDLKKVFVGISKRTNMEGFRKVKKFYESFGFTVDPVPVTKCLHLMTGVCYLGDGNFLTSALLDNETLTKIKKIGNNIVNVSKNEEYAVNVVVIDKNIVMPKGYPGTRTKIEKLGYNVLETLMSEFEKADGGVTCLSLIF